ncbi:hypothetical protein GSI_10486 [Ganoderma sinense ZZ0214-1]|uniref:Uncharacterized protein n=1 Tax=Ganoderma sinense ZZ0214-1 TaxID=1077348 RepID=A0A2G8S0P2_9APHY|nr:hypothetical protein GSI_10486 [Ganoderma sinense ZZ0214-1]
MAIFNHPLYFYDTYPFDYSSEMFNPASAPPAVNDATNTKTNHLTRTSSLTDIRNLHGPSTTTTHSPPSSPLYVPYLDLWDENAFPPIDIPLPGTLIASQPLASSSALQPPYSSSSDAVEDNENDGDPSVQVPGPSDPRGIWEVSPLSLDADADGVLDGCIIAEVRYLKPSDAPLEPDFLGESEYARARRQLEFQQPPSNRLPGSPARPFGRVPAPSTEPTAATLNSLGSGTVVERPRRSQRENKRATPPVVDDKQTTTSTSGKGKGRAVAHEPVPTSSKVSGKSKRKREASGKDASAIAEVNSTQPPAFKKQKLSTKEVEKMMTVAAMVGHFASYHYSENERKSEEKLRCRWGECEKELTYGQLVRHVKADHIDARWPCLDCGMKFTRPNGVSRHKSSESACTKNQAAATSRACQ